MPRQHFPRIFAGLVVVALLAASPGAAEWTHWRGPDQNGVSAAEDLIDSWSKEGENLIWRQDFTGRSTPVVLDGRVCANGRAGEDILRQEVVACWDADSGKLLWERRFNVYNTTVPWNRVGWADLAADPETGNVYAQMVHGELVALDSEGKTVWQWTLGEDLGRFSGYGGRTNTPIVDEDRLIVHTIGAGWGPVLGKPGDRYMAFDKRSGEILWTSPAGGSPKDLNTYSTPVIATIDGRRLVIGGGSDGWIRAVEARTGREIWSFHLSQRGVNASVVVDGDTVYAPHGEENIDTGNMGRVVAIDGRGTGDVTQSHELWRVNELQAGFASPTLHEGRLYVPDNSANLHVLDAKTGETLQVLGYGTVGKGSPVFADDKIYQTEVNGNFLILGLGEEGVEELNKVHLEVPGGRYAEIYGSAAIAYGRIYFTTEEGIYCLGKKGSALRQEQPRTQPAAARAAADAKPAHLQVVPAVVVARAGEVVQFRAHVYDDKGQLIGDAQPNWKLNGLPGTIDQQGRLTLGSDVAGTAVGMVNAESAGLKASSQLRVSGPLPWSEDFSTYDIGQRPVKWLGTGKGAKVQELDGEKVLAQPKAPRGAPRASMYLATSDMAGYTIQADARGQQIRRTKTDVGVINSGYTLDLQGNHQRIQIRSWSSERRMMQQMPFAWDMDTWYTLKLRVDIEDRGGQDKAIVRGKVWKRGEQEPAEWTMTVEDPLPIRNGAPGLYTFAPIESFFDNVKVFANDGGEQASIDSRTEIQTTAQATGNQVTESSR